MPIGLELLKSLPVVGGLIGGAIDSETARRNTDRTIQANKEMAQFQYSKDTEMWNKANEYNSPQEQMKRLDAANLNPNLVYGNGSAANTTQATMPKYQAPQMQYNYKAPVDIPGVISAYQDYEIKNAQLDNLRAQNTAIKQETANKIITEKLLGFKHQMAPDIAGIMNTKSRSEYNKYEQQLKLNPYQLEIAKENARKGTLGNQFLFEQIAKTRSGTENLNLQNEWFVEKLMGNWLGTATKGAAGIIGSLGRKAGIIKPMRVNKSLSNTKWNSPSRWEQALKQ